jgi:hypothetical protein
MHVKDPRSVFFAAQSTRNSPDENKSHTTDAILKTTDSHTGYRNTKILFMTIYILC